MKRILKGHACFVSVLLLSIPFGAFSEETIELKGDFQTLLEVHGAKYYVEREHFVRLKGVATFLETLKRQNDDMVGSALSLSLLEYMGNTETFLSVQNKFDTAVTARIEMAERRIPTSVSGEEARPDPMSNLFICVPDAKRYVTRNVEYGMQYGVPWLGMSREDYLALKRRLIEASVWDQTTPTLGPCMLEIALKGWQDDNVVSTLKNKGWGDFYRYMAIQLLGELRYKESSGILLQFLSNDKEDRYLRAHAARALSKIGGSDYLETLIKMKYLEELPNEVRSEIDLSAFDQQEVVRILSKFCLNAHSTEKATTFMSALAKHVAKVPDLIPEAKGVMEQVSGKWKDIRVRRIAQDLVRQLSGEKDIWSRPERTDLWYERCIPAMEWDVLYAEALGKPDPEALKRVREKYLEIIDAIAQKYSNGNAFATKELHNEGWPATVTNVEARTFFTVLTDLKQGMSREEVFKLLGPSVAVESGIPQCNVGKEVEYLRVTKRFNEVVEGPYGLRTQSVGLTLIFVLDKLHIVHAPQK